MEARYGNREGLLTKANPTMQRWCAQNVKQCHFGDFPTLAELKVFGDNTPIMWLVPQLVNLSEFCGARDKLTNDQLEDLAAIIAQQFYYLKISELMLFFFRFKSGKYGRFYGSVDPLIIVTAIRDFLKERGRAIDEHDREEQRKCMEQAAAEAVTWEEYRATHPVTNEANPFER